MMKAAAVNRPSPKKRREHDTQHKKNHICSFSQAQDCSLMMVPAGQVL
jgi:hypothetical protein